MSRFVKLAISWNGSAVPFKFIANDGNLVVNPIQLTQLDEQGIAERYDIVIDFSQFRVGEKLYLVNLLEADRWTQARQGPDTCGGSARAIQDDPVAGTDHGVPRRQLGARAWTSPASRTRPPP